MSEKLDFTELKATGLLPSPKGVALTVMQLCQKENVPLPDLARTIQADPVLAGRIVKIANVANPNKSRPIASVTIDTLILIGIHAVRQVVLGFSLVSAYREGGCKAFDYSGYWSHSVAMASAAQAIGATLRIAPPAELFTCGLLSDIGKLAIAAARPEAYSEIIVQLRENPAGNLATSETQRFGMSHRDLGAEMMLDWGFPKLFIDAVFHHEDPEESGFVEGSRQRKLTYILQLANSLADAFLATAEKRESMMPHLLQLGGTLGLSAEQIVNIANQTANEWREWGRLLNISIGEIPEFSLEDKKPENGTTENPDLRQAIAPMSILFADDDETLVFMANKVLATAGHTVFTARNGRQAFDIALKEKPQVIVADWIMPETDGLALCRAIRDTSWGKAIYFVMLTTLEDDQHQIDAFEAGADAFLKKPFNPRLLNAKLLAAQRRFQGG